MAIKIEYDRTDTDRDRIIADQLVLGNVLIEDHLHIDEAFLVFEDAAIVQTQRLAVEVDQLKDELKNALVWQFRMIQAIWETGISKSLWTGADITDVALRQKYIRWRDVVLDRLAQLGE